MPVFVTACPRNCYSTCGLRVEVEDGRVRRIEPLPQNRATPLGACLKGLAYVERATSPDRLLHPLRRRADGGFERIGWDAALDLVAEWLRRCRDESGPASVAYVTGSGTKGLLNGCGMAFWRVFGGCTATYGDLCWPAGLEATRLTLGDNLHNAPWDLANARLIVFWGKNPAETNLHQMPFVEEARAAGARVVVIDPRRTETAERADLLLRPRPGTDGALALGLAHALFAAGHVDRDFVARHVLGADAYAERVRAWPLERAAEVADVPLADLRTLATWLGTVRPVTLCPGFGMQRYTNSGQTMRALLALLALTGNIGRPGAGWVYANLATQVFGERDPLAFYPPERTEHGVRVSLSIARLGRDMLAQRDPALRMAWVERGNPLTQCPDTGTVTEAFRRLEFRVVVEEFMTDTARAADLVLPAKNLFEQTDVIGAYWHPYLQLRAKVLEPPPEVRPESEVWWHLARRLGVPEARLAGLIPAPGDAAVEAWLRARLAALPGVTLERLREGPVIAPGAPEVAFADLRFATPSGRIEIESHEAARRWGVDPLPDFRPPDESPAADPPLAARHPLHLLTPNTKNRIHSQFGNLRMIRALDGARATVAMHPDDARARGVDEGDTVEIHNDRGALRLAVRLDHGLRPGCVVVTNGWWEAQGGSVNRLSLGRETDLGHGAAFHDDLVEVRRVAPPRAERA